MQGDPNTTPTQLVECKLLFKHMKNTQKGFVGIVIGIVIALILAGGAYIYLENRKDNSSAIESHQIVNNEQNTNSENTASEPVNNVPIKNTDVSADINGKCGLTVSSPLPNEKFTWPLVIKGKVAPQQSQINNDCSWQTFEGVSGTAQLYFNENNKGWKSVGDSVIFGPNLSVTFNYTEIGLPMNTPMKVVFTEENPAVIRSSLVFELPLVLK